jgi:hypothetical protein
VRENRRLPVGMSSRSSGFILPGTLSLRRWGSNASPPLSDEQELIPTALRRFVAAPLPLAPNAKPRTPNAKRYTPCLGKN